MLKALGSLINEKNLSLINGNLKTLFQFMTGVSLWRWFFETMLWDSFEKKKLILVLNSGLDILKRIKDGCS